MATPTPYSGFDKQYIAGIWRDGSSGEREKDINPYNNEVLTELVLADKRDVDEAYAAALEAQKSWAQTLPAERAAVMNAVVRIFDERHDELIEWVQKESGSIRAKAEFEVIGARNIAFEAASFPYRMHGGIMGSDTPGKENRYYRSPLGVITTISPWNFPMNLSNRSVATALAVGNAVVLKPASDTPITGGLLLAKIYEEAGLPQGLLSVVLGKGSVIGDYLVEHHIPKLISFTGSSSVGMRLGALAVNGAHMKRIALELGGNSPLVVLDDADIDLAVDIAITGRFLHQGQICMSTNRIIVDAKVIDEFTDKFVARASKLSCGDPLDPATNLGPIINKEQFDKIQGIITQAKADGFTVALEGEAKGQIIPPHVFTNVDPNSDLAINESFGPVVPIIEAANEEDALRLANMSDYGLSSAVCTRDTERGLAFALQIDAGMTHINDMTVADEQHMPFGGEKNSGLGRFNGDWILEEMTRTHWISIQHTPHPYPL